MAFSAKREESTRNKLNLKVETYLELISSPLQVILEGLFFGQNRLSFSRSEIALSTPY
jgi:hypothetical protein